MLDLTLPGATKMLADKIVTGIDAATELQGKHSWRVKPSMLGKECIAAGWYAFRWAKRVNKPGKVARIFAKGHDTEPRLIDYLRRSGWIVLDVDPAKAGKKFEQWNFKALNGHMSAYLDGIGSHPEYTGGLWVLIEAKSYNKRRFNLLTSKGNVKLTDYEYYVQVCLYMMGYNLPWTLLICECKDDGDIHVEVIMRDDETAQRALSVGNTIMTNRIRPARVAESAAFHVCKKCDFQGVCHLGEQVEKNCRSCLHCVAVEGGKFACERWNAVIPNEDAIMQACDQHDPIK